MADQATAAKPVSNSKKMLTIVAVAIGLAGGWKGFLAKSPGQGPAEDGQKAVTTTTHPGPVVNLEPVTTNVAGGRYVKVTIALQLAGDAAPEAETAGPDDPTKGYARALDVAIETLSNGDGGALGTPAGRAAAKAQLLKGLQAAYGEDVEDVYFTQFVVS